MILTTHLLAYDTCTMSGWWKLAWPFLRPEGTGLNSSLSSSVSTRLIDSMSLKEASVIGRACLYETTWGMRTNWLKVTISNATCGILVWSVDHQSLVFDHLEQRVPGKRKMVRWEVHTVMYSSSMCSSWHWLGPCLVAVVLMLALLQEAVKDYIQWAKVILKTFGHAIVWSGP